MLLPISDKLLLTRNITFHQKIGSLQLDKVDSFFPIKIFQMLSSYIKPTLGQRYQVIMCIIIKQYHFDFRWELVLQVHFAGKMICFFFLYTSKYIYIYNMIIWNKIFIHYYYLIVFKYTPPHTQIYINMHTHRFFYYSKCTPWRTTGSMVFFAFFLNAGSKPAFMLFIVVFSAYCIKW